jgi:hypothetical protein
MPEQHAPSMALQTEKAQSSKRENLICMHHHPNAVLEQHPYMQQAMS